MSKENGTNPSESKAPLMSRRDFGKLALLVAGSSIAGGVVGHFIQKATDQSQADTPALNISNGYNVDWNAQEMQHLSTPSSTPEQRFTPTAQLTPEVSIVPQNIQGYRFGVEGQTYVNVDDISRRIIMFFRDQANTFPMAPVRPYGWNGDQKLFLPYQRTMLSYQMDIDGYTASWMHSGPNMPSENLVRLVLNTPEGKRRTTIEVNAFLATGIVGNQLCVMQEKESGILPVTWPDKGIEEYETNTNMLPNRIKAAAFITNDAIAAYELHVNDQVSWLQEDWEKSVHKNEQELYDNLSGIYQTGGWMDANPKTDWLLKTCVRNTKDQPLDAIDYSHNRLLLLLTPESGGWRNFDIQG